MDELLQPIYRIKISPSGVVYVTCYDLLEEFKQELKPRYSSVDDLPKWAQEKLAVLMLFDVKGQLPDIKGVGRRIDTNLFWIYKE